jgi:hypothetical protein
MELISWMDCEVVDELTWTAERVQVEVEWSCSFEVATKKASHVPPSDAFDDDQSRASDDFKTTPFSDICANLWTKASKLP